MAQWVMRRVRLEGGFTLIETVAAFTIFAIVAVALLGMLIAGIRTAGSARDRTVGKELARERLEEMRRMPYYVQHSTGNECIPEVKVDLLDTYFPNSTSTKFDAATSTYTRVIDPVQGFPTYRITIASKFVDSALATVAPPVDYDCTNAVADRPPSDLLSAEITVTWGEANPGTYSLRSYLGEAKLGDVEVQGSATGTVVRIDTAFSDSSTLLAESGLGTVTIFVGNVTSSRSDLLAARARITQSGGEISEGLGAASSAGAPPDAGPLSAISVGTALTHPLIPQLGPVLTIGPSEVKDLLVNASSTALSASGALTLRHTGLDEEEGGPAGMSASNEVASTPARPIDTLKPFATLAKVKSLRPSKLQMNCNRFTLKVTCGAQASMGGLRVAPVDFLPLGNKTDSYLIEVKLSSLAVSATASRSGSGGLASATFSGEISYWELNLDATPPAYVLRKRTFSSASVSSLPDPAGICLRTLLPVTPICDLHLSDYIAGWDIAGGTASVSANHTAAEANLDGVVRITTQPTNTALSNTGFLIRAGFLSARSVDLR